MSVVELFPKKLSSIPEGETVEESMAYFYNKLDTVMGEFHSLSPHQKYEVMESLIEFNKTMTGLYLNLRKEYKFNQDWYSDLTKKLESAVAKNKEFERD